MLQKIASVILSCKEPAQAEQTIHWIMDLRKKNVLSHFEADDLQRIASFRMKTLASYRYVALQSKLKN